jgi:predicted dehydrogenase
MHARGYLEAGGFNLAAVADLIPQRRRELMSDFGIPREYADAKELVADKEIDAISICLPTALHAPITIAALRSGKHVVCEKPPALDAKQARLIERAATKAGKVVLYSLQRRFGGAEQAAKQAISKGYAGEVFHARSQWLRTRGIPIGTGGWFSRKAESGGGPMIDIGIHMLDLGWHLLGQPRPLSVFGATHEKFRDLAPKGVTMDVEDSAFALIRFDGGRSLEVAASWTLNQPPQQQGTLCRVLGDKAAIDVYTPNGAMLYRNFDEKGQARATPLKPPRFTGHGPLMRHFRECIGGRAKPQIGPAQGVILMQMIEAIYKSAATGKSVNLRE